MAATDASAARATNSHTGQSSGSVPNGSKPNSAREPSTGPALSGSGASELGVNSNGNSHFTGAADAQVSANRGHTEGQAAASDSVNR
jgi:hypothetical protein